MQSLYHAKNPGCFLPSPAAAVGKDRCRWPEVAKRKGQVSTGIEAGNWGAGAVETVCSRGKDGWGL